MGTAHLSLETWVAIGLIATIGILASLGSVGIYLEHSLMVTALNREARRLRLEQQRRIDELDAKDEVTAVDVLYEDGTVDEATTGEPKLGVEEVPETDVVTPPSR